MCTLLGHEQLDGFCPYSVVMSLSHPRLVLNKSGHPRSKQRGLSNGSQNA
jgi:hypothetical protein